MEVKFKLKSFGGEIDPERLNQWFKQMEAYFWVQKIESDEEKIEIATLKLEGHALVWWEAYLDSNTSFEEVPMIRWSAFKELLRDQFYPLGHHQKQTMEWFDFKQAKG